MPNGTFFQTANSLLTHRPSTHAPNTNLINSLLDTSTASNDTASKLAEAIDDFLGDLEKKFKVVSDEILTKCRYASFHVSGVENLTGKLTCM
jgi:hypothetical protein